jgi:hypothetical protein
MHDLGLAVKSDCSEPSISRVALVTMEVCDT